MTILFSVVSSQSLIFYGNNQTHSHTSKNGRGTSRREERTGRTVKVNVNPSNADLDNIGSVARLPFLYQIPSNKKVSVQCKRASVSKTHTHIHTPPLTISSKSFDANRKTEFFNSIHGSFFDEQRNQKTRTKLSSQL